jgi:hypothetical protein
VIFKQKLLTFVFVVCSLFSTSFALAGQTADFDDIYLMGSAGWRNDGHLQLGVGAGYVFTEGFGIGGVFEYSKNQPYGGAELRWFLEPFESAIFFGLERRLIDAKAQLSPMFSLSGDYLYSLTPSLAIRASVRWLLPLQHGSGVFTGAGFRILF